MAERAADGAMKTAQRSDPPGSSREGLPLLGERAGGVGLPRTVAQIRFEPVSVSNLRGTANWLGGKPVTPTHAATVARCP